MKLTILDKAAIDHVASVSKHPHSAMIVKWLITGWDVEFLHKNSINDYNIAPFPNWHPDTIFRLSEPKPVKPAYRVYIEKSGGDPETVTRESYEKYKDKYDGNVEWLGDWIEYDEPKKWPTPLVERIAAIDIKAAQWIVDNWDDLIDRKYRGNPESDKLSYMFTWGITPQGQDYWNDISNKLG